jgi:hypothetical protein
MKVHALQRAEFVGAREHGHGTAIANNWRGEQVTPPAVDLALEPLVEVLNGSGPSIFTRIGPTIF